MDIHEFIKARPLISYSGIEKLLGLTHGSIRADKPIPERYIQMVTDLLKLYGSVEEYEKVMTTEEKGNIKLQNVNLCKGIENCPNQKPVKQVRVQGKECFIERGIVWYVDPDDPEGRNQQIPLSHINGKKVFIVVD